MFCVLLQHGGMDENQRKLNLQMFHSCHNKILITTDEQIQSIYLDVVKIIINYVIPSKAESYINRITSGGRFRWNGTVISLVTEQEKLGLIGIEQVYNTTILEMPTDVFIDKL